MTKKALREAYLLQTPVSCSLVYGYKNLGVAYVISIFKIFVLGIGAYTTIYTA
jgi:hypothetical protein